MTQYDLYAKIVILENENKRLINTIVKLTEILEEMLPTYDEEE